MRLALRKREIEMQMREAELQKMSEAQTRKQRILQMREKRAEEVIKRLAKKDQAKMETRLKTKLTEMDVRPRL